MLVHLQYALHLYGFETAAEAVYRFRLKHAENVINARNARAARAMTYEQNLAQSYGRFPL